MIPGHVTVSFGGTPEEATAAAKAWARSNGLRLRTVAARRPSADGWDVTLVVGVPGPSEACLPGWCGHPCAPGDGGGFSRAMTIAGHGTTDVDGSGPCGCDHHEAAA